MTPSRPISPEHYAIQTNHEQEPRTRTTKIKGPTPLHPDPWVRAGLRPPATGAPRVVDLSQDHSRGRHGAEDHPRLQPRVPVEGGRDRAGELLHRRRRGGGAAGPVVGRRRRDARPHRAGRRAGHARGVRAVPRPARRRVQRPVHGGTRWPPSATPAAGTCPRTSCTPPRLNASRTPTAERRAELRVEAGQSGAAQRRVLRPHVQRAEVGHAAAHRVRGAGGRRPHGRGRGDRRRRGRRSGRRSRTRSGRATTPGWPTSRRTPATPGSGTTAAPRAAGSTRTTGSSRRSSSTTPATTTRSCTSTTRCSTASRAPTGCGAPSTGAACSGGARPRPRSPSARPRSGSPTRSGCWSRRGPDGKAREIVGVAQEAMDLISTRRRQAHREGRGAGRGVRGPARAAPRTALERDRLLQQATLATRRGEVARRRDPRGAARPGRRDSSAPTSTAAWPGSPTPCSTAREQSHDGAGVVAAGGDRDGARATCSSARRAGPAPTSPGDQRRAARLPRPPRRRTTSAGCSTPSPPRRLRCADAAGRGPARRRAAARRAAAGQRRLRLRQAPGSQAVRDAGARAHRARPGRGHRRRRRGRAAARRWRAGSSSGLRESGHRARRRPGRRRARRAHLRRAGRDAGRPGRAPASRSSSARSPAAGPTPRCTAVPPRRVFGLATSQIATDVLAGEGLTARNVDPLARHPGPARRRARHRRDRSPSTETRRGGCTPGTWSWSTSRR